jgi:hypothetical protein
MPIGKRQRPSQLPVIPEEPVFTSNADTSDTSKLTTYQEDENLRLIYSELSPAQINAARLESMGMIDRQLIASQCGVTPETITSWRSNPRYKQLVGLNLSIIDRLSRDSRISSVKQIIAPAFAELSKRMSDNNELKAMSTKDLILIITKMSNEIRMDTTVAVDDQSENDLVDLQRRRAYLQAEQQQEINRLKDNGKIIELPKAMNG